MKYWLGATISINVKIMILSTETIHNLHILDVHLHFFDVTMVYKSINVYVLSVLCYYNNTVPSPKFYYSFTTIPKTLSICFFLLAGKAQFCEWLYFDEISETTKIMKEYRSLFERSWRYKCTNTGMWQDYTAS